MTLMRTRSSLAVLAGSLAVALSGGCAEKPGKKKDDDKETKDKKGKKGKDAKGKKGDKKGDDKDDKKGDKKG
ncbi:MAG: hypothetical protein AAF721_09695 [Myxococcota bacterium]